MGLEEAAVNGGIAFAGALVGNASLGWTKYFSLDRGQTAALNAKLVAETSKLTSEAKKLDEEQLKIEAEKNHILAKTAND
jgi:uncharacterized protein (DUF849 family)